jgi:hypothetical protein
MTGNPRPFDALTAIAVNAAADAAFSLFHGFSSEILFIPEIGNKSLINGLGNVIF